MDIKDIDKNFDTSFEAPADLEWFSAREVPFSTHGVYYAEEEGLYRRMPKEVADSVSAGVAHLSKNTAGGRIRFITDSPYIAIRMVEPFEQPFSHMAITGKCGVSVFVDHTFLGTIMPSYAQLKMADPSLGGTGKIVFDGIKKPHLSERAEYLVEIFLPLYSCVSEFCIGLQKGCSRKEPTKYKHERPLLFYGSSITQGGCASKPADDYIGRLSRMLDADFINLGFSGNAKAEKPMVDYLVAQDPAVFILDYDHNAPNAEHLRNTHFPMYEAIRRAHPTTPIVIMTKPTAEGFYENMPAFRARREEVLKSFEKARAQGDTRVYLADCYGCFGTDVNGECGTVDETHPDSVGFLRMAERVYPILNHILNGEA